MSFKSVAVACGTAMGVALALSTRMAAENAGMAIQVATLAQAAPLRKIDRQADELLSKRAGRWERPTRSAFTRKYCSTRCCRMP